ncbi:MAG: hypothetical protein A3I05_08760 [Deltaproteobacteria bacterium RIFCSPLOWO2_02_FULL_44_10]|nr:MAG: hypothetical protein A3C46_02290 [Deltaproteobacteria bacterium RIFCSPHIGHO2_02_FULL_44_16]OGQ45786.1 MAG: hypothetical protein A3I05_08760 [Deltaproteobacteria bacterium RIFCSPLOWO2_02_FULL_44_10]
MKSSKKNTSLVVRKDGKILRQNFYSQVKDIILQARGNAYRSVNFIMVEAYWNVGRLIVEEEQKGKKRADYGEHLILSLAEKLTREFGEGYSLTNLKYFRQFYLAFQKGHAVRGQSESRQKSHALRDQLVPFGLRPELSWTHYRLLLKVEKETARQYYLEEAVAGNWSTRQLERQINSFYYERLLMSRKRSLLKKTTNKLEPPATAADLIKDPFVLEFLNVKRDAVLQEKELETLLINKLQDFLLELGRGFSFVGRQHRISAGTKHFYIDLVFYNYVLKCFILIDLKMGELTHQDIGQMDFYVRFFEDKLRGKEDNPTIGIVLCSEKEEAVVKYSVLNDGKRIFASKYKLYLPTEEELKKELEHEREVIEQEKRLLKG